MPGNQLVSTIIPSYNRSATLCEAVESALNQRYSPLEVIVVDDGSTDDTEAKIAQFGKRVIFIRREHKGAAAARNAGIELSRGEFIAFLDADDLWRPHKIGAQVQYLNENPQIGMLCSDAREFNENGTVSESFLAQFGKIETEGFVFDSIAKTAFPLTSTVVLRRNCLEGLRFNETLANFQDIDFFMRLNLRRQMAALKQVLVDRRLHIGNVSRSQYNRFFYRAVAFENILADGTPLSVRQRRTVKNLLGVSCCKIADCHWDTYELSQAREWYSKALGLNTVGLDAFLHMLLTFLPQGSISLLRQFKTAMNAKLSF